MGHEKWAFSNHWPYSGWSSQLWGRFDSHNRTAYQAWYFAVRSIYTYISLSMCSSSRTLIQWYKHISYVTLKLTILAPLTLVFKRNGLRWQKLERKCSFVIKLCQEGVILTSYHCVAVKHTLNNHSEPIKTYLPKKKRKNHQNSTKSEFLLFIWNSLNFHSETLLQLC